jgi:predicted site-specific integrase-resolvase
VGAAEAAELLDVELPRITRWRLGGRMPEPVALLASTPVWRRDDVLAMKNGKQTSRSDEVELMGTSEAAKVLNVNKSQISRWLRKGKFPPPRARLAAGPVWTAQQIRFFRTTRV